MIHAETIHALMGRTTALVSICDADGEVHHFADLAQAGIFADGIKDPWLDMVDSEGNGFGQFVAGVPAAFVQEPSVVCPDGVVYLYDGDPVPNMPTGVHYLPLDALTECESLDDLYWYLPEDVTLATDASDRQITLMSGQRRDEKQGKWKETGSTFDQFTHALMNHQAGQKDGPCFLQGKSANGARKAVAMIENHILGVDLDSGATLEEIRSIIMREKLQGVIYSTHSHLKDTSQIKRDHFMKWCGGEDPTEDLVRQYLTEVKGILPRIVKNVEIVDEAHHTDEGVVMVVKHAPIPKFRAIFVLNEPFVFARRGGSQQDAISEWKEKYAGFCTKLGLFFDEKCVDPARLFYLPRHPKGAAEFGAWVVYGGTLDLEKYDRVKMRRGRDGKRTATSANPFSAAAGDVGRDDDDADRYMVDGLNLVGWASKNAQRFEVQTMLEERAAGDDVIREPRGGKPGVHIACPFEAEHTGFGGQGTFVVNASDNYDEGNDSGFSIVCVHNACSGRDRLDFLKGMIEEQMIEVADLKNKDYLIALADDPEEEEAPQRAQHRAPDDVPHVDGISDDEEIDFGDTEDSMVAAFNRLYAVVRSGGGVRILVEPRQPGDDISFESRNDVSLYEQNRVFWIKDGSGSRKVEGFKAWLESEKRRTYSRVLFAPGRRVDKMTYNLFRGWPYQAKKPEYEHILDNKDVPVKGDWSMLRGHIYENICESNDEYFEWLMTWLSQVFQKAESKPGSTVVITGEKGTGKSTLFDYMNKLLGQHGITVSQRKQIVGQFNGHLATTLLMVCEEAFWAADPQAEGVLKDLITNKSVLIERKGADPIQSDNYTRLALVSNSNWVVPASLKDERRFFVLRCSSARRGDIDFFDDLRNQMDNLGGLEAMMWDLLHWKPVNGSYGCLFTPPVTSYLKEQQIETLSGVHKFMLELVKSGIYETHDDKVVPIELSTDTETMVYAVDMRAAVDDYCKYRFQSEKARTSFDDISAVIQDWFGAKEIKTAIDGGMNRKRTFIFPPLSVVRAKLKETKGLDIEAMPEEEVKSLRVRSRG